MKKCKKGHYYCYKDSKCKPIPKGYRIGLGGYLRREREDETEDSKKNGNGNGNGNSKSNGNGGNGSGNGNGGSGGNAGGNGSGGGVGESVEIQNSDGDTTAVVVDILGPAHMRPRLNGKGVWTGTHITEAGQVAFGGYKDGIIINPSGSRNKYGLPDNLKPERKTKEVPLTPSQNRLLVMGKKKNVTGDYIKGTQKNLDDGIDKNIHGVGKGKKIKKILGGPDINLAHYEPDGELIENAAVLSKGSKLLPTLATGIGFVGSMLQARKKRKIGAMEKRYHQREMGDRSNDMIRARRGEADKQNKLIDKYERTHKSQQEKNSRKNIIKGVKGGEVVQDEYIPERKMTEKEKRKDDRLKKKYDKSDMKKSMQKQYGKEEGKKVYFATIRKQAMEEEKKKDHEPEMIRNQLKTAKRASKRIKSHTLKKDNFKAWVQSKITKASDYLDTAADYLDSKDDMKEGKDPKLTKIVKQLRKSVKSHGKQADYIEKINEKNCGCGQTPCKTYGKDVKEAKNIDDKLKKTAKELDAAVKMHTKQAERLRAMVNVKEESNPRIPRKKGQPANSKKHSDLYTDENPKGTIHGLGFKDVATAKASVAKIRKSNRSHAHKIQAAVAMEQRAREMGKTSEAAVYRKFINSMKKKTKD